MEGGSSSSPPFQMGIMTASFRISLLPLIVILLMAALSFFRNQTWLDEYTLWSDVVQKSPNLALPHINLGNAFVRRGALDSGVVEYEAALGINPLDTRAINGLAVVAYRRERFEDAVRLFHILAKEKPRDPYFHNNLGSALLRLERIEEAVEHFQQAVRLRPEFSDAFINLGKAFLLQGHMVEASDAFRQALRISPGHPGALSGLADLESQWQNLRQVKGDRPQPVLP